MTRRSTLAPSLALLAALASSASAQDAPPALCGASSLIDVLGEAARRFEAASGVRPRLALASSSRLVRQIQAGAPADVVVTADEAWMDVLEADDLLAPGTRRVLLTNRLVLAVPKRGRGSNADADDLVPGSASELADVRLKRIAVSGPATPAGRRAREALAHHGVLGSVEARLVQAPSVRAALALVARGEVDAGIVYATDARASEHVRVAFSFAATSHAPIRYPIALTPSGRDRPDARALYAFLTGPSGRALFAEAGFGVVEQGPDGAVGANSAGRRSTSSAPPPDWLHPLELSLWVATLSLLLSLAPALLLGWLLARREFPGKALVSTALMVPLVLPPVVTGYLLLAVFGRGGPLGDALEAVGLEVVFSRWGAVLAAAVVGFPLLILMVRTAIEAVDPRYEQLARTLGRHPLAAFAQVTLPMAWPGVLAGCVLAFARALGEFGATAIVASDVPGETRTLALAVFSLFEEPGGEDAARTLVGISLVLCLLALAGYERLNRAQKQRLDGRA